MRDGKLDGMQEFDSVIRDFIERRVVSIEDGLAFATNKNNLLLELKGLASSEDFIRAELDGVPVGQVSDSGSLLNMIE